MPHRLRAPLEEDQRAYPGSSLAEMHRRLGEELGAHLLRRQLLLMTRSGLVEVTVATATDAMRWWLKTNNCLINT